jgi:hypothetical protein
MLATAGKIRRTLLASTFLFRHVHISTLGLIPAPPLQHPVALLSLEEQTLL